MLKTNKEDSPLGIQITGSSLEEFKKLIPFLKKSKFNLIDLNCGCPAARIIGTKAGSYLLKDPKKIAQIIKLLKQTKKPVTAKIRLGFNKNNVLQIAKAIEKAGADAITIHPRKSNDSYEKPADWNEIKKLKSILKIPVIANGDIFTPEDIKKVLEFADAVMLGRAAISNPQIFSLKENNTKENKLKILEQYLNLCSSTKVTDLQKIKFTSSHILSNFQGAAKLRNKLMKCKSFKEIEKITI